MSLKEDPREIFIAALVGSSKARIKKFPGFIIFLGGQVASVSEPNHESASLRSFLMSRWAGSQKFFDRIWCPEEFKDWAQYSTYEDLVEFETDLASLASVVLLICESAGAIAELGCFSQIKGLVGKLLVVFHGQHVTQDSFIQLGLAKYMTRKHCGDHRLLSFDWDFSRSHPVDIEQELASIILEYSDSFPSSQFDSDNPAHLMLFLHTLLMLFQPLTIREMTDYLSRFNDEIKEARVKRLLFVLNKLEIIMTIRRGRSDYYFLTQKFIDKRFFDPNISNTDYSFDESRLIVEIANYYRECDTPRSRAQGEYLNGSKNGN